MPWTDDAIMVSVTQDTKKSLLLDVMTRMRGRCRLKVALDGSPIPPLYPGCSLKLTQLDAGFGEVPVAELHEANGGLENADTNVSGMTVLHGLRKMLETFLPPYEPARGVYTAASQMIPILRDDDGRWPLYYLVWEMELLSTLGPSDRCVHLGDRPDRRAHPALVRTRTPQRRNDSTGSATAGAMVARPTRLRHRGDDRRVERVPQPAGCQPG